MSGSAEEGVADVLTPPASVLDLSQQGMAMLRAAFT
jgi:hypothetical protein